jgi:hypothetical protein
MRRGKGDGRKEGGREGGACRQRTSASTFLSFSVWAMQRPEMTSSMEGMPTFSNLI